MKRLLVIVLLLTALCASSLMVTGCGKKEQDQQDTQEQQMNEPNNTATSGTPETVRFAVAWSENADPKAAGAEAVENAFAALGCPAKGVVFYTYYQDPEFVPDETTQATAVKADVQAEDAVAAAIAQTCGDVPNIGCRARSLVNGGTLLKNAVSVLAVGGEQADVMVKAMPILDDRSNSGKQIGRELAKVKDLKLIIALAEMRLSFEAKDGVSVEDFIRGILTFAPEEVTLFGGNSMPDDMATTDLAGKQFLKGNPLKGHVVAMGIGAPINVFSNHTNEFQPSGQTVTVTDVQDKWIVTMDDKPAMQVYRELRGMAEDEELTSDWQHPIGVVVGDEKVYLRMVLNWVNADGTDMDGQEVDLPPGSLKFVAPVSAGSKIKILKGGSDAQAILASAKQGISEIVSQAKDSASEPALCLLSDCCARGMRFRTFGKPDNDEILQAVLPALGDVPVFGFYAWGELGPIRGEYQGMKHQYQQHTFISALAAIE